MPYAFPCHKCGKTISLLHGECYRIVWVEVKGVCVMRYEHLYPTCDEVHRKFRVIQGGKNG